MKLTGENRSTRRKTWPSPTLSTTNPICTNTGLRGGRPAANRPSHDTALVVRVTRVLFGLKQNGHSYFCCNKLVLSCTILVCVVSGASSELPAESKRPEAGWQTRNGRQDSTYSVVVINLYALSLRYTTVR